jgi:hypothetical protein
MALWRIYIESRSDAASGEPVEPAVRTAHSETLIRVGGLLRGVVLYVTPPVRKEIIHRSLERDNWRPSRRRMKP